MLVQTFYLVSCPICDRDDPLAPLPIPFGHVAKRDEWAAAHTKGTGHSPLVLWEEGRDVPDLP